MLGPLARADDSANTSIKLGKSGLLSMRAGDTVELLLDTTGEHRPRLGTQGTVAFNVNMLTSYDVEMVRAKLYYPLCAHTWNAAADAAAPPRRPSCARRSA